MSRITTKISHFVGFTDGLLFIKQPTTYKQNIEQIMKRTIRLTEGDLHRIIKQSVRMVLREYDDFGIAYYSTGKEMHMGDIVMWRDPETGRESKYEIFEEPTEDMVKLWPNYGECEALPNECTIIG